MTKIIYYDLETTGLNLYHDEIIEACYYDLGKDEYFEKLYKPTCDILPSKVTAITGLTMNVLKRQESVKNAGEDLLNWLGENSREEEIYMIAHNNNGFDKYFIKRALGTLPIKWKFIDTCLMGKYVYPSFESYSLKNMCKKLGVDYNEKEAHRGRYDVDKMMCICALMLNKLNILDMAEIYRITNV